MYENESATMTGSVKQPEIALQLEIQDKEQSRLAELISCLHDRLRPVLCEKPNANDVREGQSEKHQSDIARRLSIQVEKTSQVNTRLEYILSNLEI